MADLFKLATKEKYRFNTSKGRLSVEDLWDLSLEELDGLYKELRKEQEKDSGESLLSNTSLTRKQKALNNSIEIIKVIVSDKLEAKERAAKAAERRAQNQRILEIMADKQDAALKEKSLEELQAMLETKDYEED